MLLGSLIFDGADQDAAMLFPLVLGGVAILCSIVGTWFIRLGHAKNIMGALYKGLAVAGILAAVVFYPVTKWLMGSNDLYSVAQLYGSALVGLGVTALLVIITEYYTSTKYKPVQSIAHASESGHGTNVIQGLAISLKSTFAPLVVIVLAILAT